MYTPPKCKPFVSRNSLVGEHTLEGITKQVCQSWLALWQFAVAHPQAGGYGRGKETPEKEETKKEEGEIDKMEGHKQSDESMEITDTSKPQQNVVIEYRKHRSYTYLARYTQYEMYAYLPTLGT